MARTTAIRVMAVLEDPPSKDLGIFIDDANEMVTRLCLPTYGEIALLEKIERYIAAHLYLVTVRRPVDERLGSGQDRYEEKVDKGLELTWHGQQALMFDSEGTLDVAQTRKIRVGVNWLGDGDYERDNTKA